MLSSFRSLLMTQLSTETTDSSHQKSPEETSEKSDSLDAQNGDDSFVGGLLEILSYAKESSNKIAVEIKKSAKHITEKIAHSAPFVELDRAHAEFVEEKSNSETLVNIPPSDVLLGLDSDCPTGEAEPKNRQIKEAIYRLSSDKSNFLTPPPNTSSFQWSTEIARRHVALATALLKEDKNLAEMRFHLVPRKIKEDDFWRNYFYRVSLIRRGEPLPPTEVKSGPKGGTQVPKNGNRRAPSPTLSSPVALSIASDASIDEVEAELLLEGSDLENTVVIDEDFEKEILAELEAYEK